MHPHPPDGIAITKLDESTSIANVVNILLEEDAPGLFWVADGQQKIITEALEKVLPGGKSAEKSAEKPAKKQ